MKTHKQIWTDIAEAFYTPMEWATAQQKHIASCGLCWAFGREDNEQFNELAELLMDNNKTIQFFWFPIRGYNDHLPEHDLLRGDMATLFSCMTAREFDQLLDKP